MAVTHPSSMRALITNTVAATLNGGSTFGQLVFQAAASTQLCANTFASTAFGLATTNSSGQAVANTIVDGTVLVTGTATIAVCQAATQAREAWRGSVTSTGGGGDIELSSNVLSSGQTVSMTSLTYTSPL